MQYSVSHVATTALLVSQNGLRSNLRASNFQKFSGGACLSVACSCMQYIHIWHTCNPPFKIAAWLRAWLYMQRRINSGLHDYLCSRMHGRQIQDTLQSKSAIQCTHKDWDGDQDSNKETEMVTRIPTKKLWNHITVYNSIHDHSQGWHMILPSWNPKTNQPDWIQFIIFLLQNIYDHFLLTRHQQFLAYNCIVMCKV